MIRVGVVDAFGSVNGGAGRTARRVPIALVDEILGQPGLVGGQGRDDGRGKVPLISSCDKLCRRC